MNMWKHIYEVSIVMVVKTCYIPWNTLRKRATILQVTTILITSKNVLFPGYNHLITTGADDLTLLLLPEPQWVRGPQYRWLVGGYDLEIIHL